MENKFKEGELVYHKSAPTLKLVIRRFVLGMYYCQIHSFKDARELVYYERELEKLQDETSVLR